MPSKYFYLWILLNFSVALCAQEEVVSELSFERQGSFFDYLIRDSITVLDMSADFRTLRRQKYQEDYYEGVLSFRNRVGKVETFQVAFRTRGKSRKKHCHYPPLKLKFKKKELRAKGFDKLNKYKVVCQCNRGKRYQQALLREYLAYKVYNLISPFSFRVHLFEINYIDGQAHGSEKQYAFLLEPVKALEKRLGGKIISREAYASEALLLSEKTRMSIFQYMIANTDWNIASMHNIKLLKNAKGQLISIPYDYDYSGFVHTPYASPNPDYPVAHISDRYFIPDDSDVEELRRQLVFFQNKKENIYKLIADFGLLSKKSKRHLMRFLKGFYKIIENPKKWKRAFVREGRP